MGAKVEITGLAGAIALGLPLAVMALAIFLLQRRSRPGRPSAGVAPAESTPVPAPAASAPEAPPLSAEIARAEAANDETALARLCLELARQRAAAGHSVEAGELLRRCVRSAASQRLHHIHAQARLELGDLARASGDLTTACEHWQLARKLAADLSDSPLLQGAEDRMQRHGCPTDWVLNEF